MDLKQEILDTKSKESIQNLVKYIGVDKTKFKQLMEFYFGNDIRLTQKSSWIVNHIAENNLELLNPYLTKMADVLESKTTDSVKRNTVRLFQFIKIPEHIEGRVINSCFSFLTDVNSAIALKAFSMTVLLNSCKKYPEMANELKIIIEEMLPYGSAGIKSRGKKVLKELEQL